ncbi:MAG TPA: TetR/AcrR family transcriptional regulator [Solirubrobacterales bacterium]|nr:TetR/AcrR family transcriptional regulator [Solirubrobacterales bacterium]
MEAAATAPRPGPGRPSTGARERILEGCLEVLKEQGYAGLSIAKVAAASGESKALVSYHFGSKDGLLSAAGRELGEEITREVLDGLDGAETVEEVVSGAAGALWKLIERDERLPRVYFDLNAVSVVDSGVREVLREIKRAWRDVLSRFLRESDPPVADSRVGAVTTLILAGLEGLTLERIERGETQELDEARELFVRSVCAIAWE